VRSFYHFLIRHKLNVFFDEECVLPGEDVVTSIENALQQSRHVVLVLSPSSVASKWVALETQLAIYDDADASQNRLVPLLVEKVNWSSVRPSIRRLNCIDLTNPVDRENQLRRILTLLELASVDRKELDTVLMDIDVKAGLTSLTVADISDVLDWGWTGEKLLQEFIALDYATLDNLVPTHEGSPEQWAPVFMNHPATWKMLLSAPKEIQGYWHFAPLFSEDYARAKAGQLLDSEITADRVRLFELPGTYEVYFVQICMHPRFRNPTHVRQLFRSLVTVLDDLSEQGIYIKELCANAYTDVGKSICRSFNLERLGEHCEHGTIFAAPIADILNSPFAKTNSRLIKAYEDEGLI
jgi:TIR domain-containing protein